MCLFVFIKWNSTSVGTISIGLQYNSPKSKDAQRSCLKKLIIHVTSISNYVMTFVNTWNDTSQKKTRVTRTLVTHKAALNCHFFTKQTKILFCFIAWKNHSRFYQNSLLKSFITASKLYKSGPKFHNFHPQSSTKLMQVGEVNLSDCLELSFFSK